MLNGKENGFYVEVGADDGENFSNSLFFEGTVLFTLPATRFDYLTQMRKITNAFLEHVLEIESKESERIACYGNKTVIYF